MSSRVRLLPALIGAAGVLMMLRLGAIAASTDQTAAAPAATDAAVAAAAPAAASAAPAADGEHATAAATPDATHTDPATAASATPLPPVASGANCQSALAPAGQAQTKGEAEVLQNLTRRRDELDGRARDLGMREQLMGATEKRISERVAELKALETKLDGMLAQRDAAEETQMGSLVKTYENMKPTDAAKIFNKLDRQILLSVAQRMKPAKIGAVMAAMDPARAQDLTVMLATRMKVSANQPVSLAPAAAPAGGDMPVGSAPVGSAPLGNTTPPPAPEAPIPPA